MAQTDMKVIDPATGETVGPDVDGELCTRGYFVMMGYFDNPDATAAAIDADGWLHTGDLAAMDSRGYCRITGRLKDMIIRGGENIYPKEIEQVLFEHEDVADVAVVGVPDPTWGEQVAAFVRPADGRTPDPDRLRTYCRDRLAPHKVPLYWLAVDEFPTTPSGKVQKFLLRERFAASAPSPTAGAEDQEELLASLRSGGPDQPVAEAVQLAVRATLGCRPEELHGGTRFTDVGGDSLSALKVSKLLEEIFDTEVPAGYVSTVGVAFGGDVLDEDVDIRVASRVRTIDDSYANGYVTSKWASEVLMREAHDLCGLPVAVFRCDMILAHTRYVGQLNVPDVFTRLMLSLVATGIAPNTFYGHNGERSRPRAHYDGLPVDFIAEAIAKLGANATDGFHTYNVVNPHDDGISLDQFVDWLIDAGNPIQRVDDYGDWLVRFEAAMRALPDNQRRYSELALLEAFKPPSEVLNGPILPAERFRAGVREACIGPDRDIPHISRDLIGKYVADLRQLELL